MSRVFPAGGRACRPFQAAASTARMYRLMLPMNMLLLSQAVKQHTI